MFGKIEAHSYFSTQKEMRIPGWLGAPFNRKLMDSRYTPDKRTAKATSMQQRICGKVESLCIIECTGHTESSSSRSKGAIRKMHASLASRPSPLQPVRVIRYHTEFSITVSRLIFFPKERGLRIRIGPDSTNHDLYRCRYVVHFATNH